MEFYEEYLMVDGDETSEVKEDDDLEFPENEEDDEEDLSDDDDGSDDEEDDEESS